MKNPTSKHSKEELMKLRKLPLDQKMEIAEIRILEFFHKLDGKVYISFSGGKDSTVLLHLVRSILPNIQCVFADTGLEFPEIRDFVKKFDNVVWLKPEKNFRDVIKDNGYPLISKEIASTVNGAKRSPNSVRGKKLDGSFKGTSKYDQSKYAYLLKAPFELNDKCCDVFKKKPFKKFEKETGLLGAYIGTRAEESMLRETSWIRYGCNIFREDYNKSMPMSIWSDKDVNDYIEMFGLEIAEPYHMGYERTGCVFCAFGAHLESYPNRFQKLQKTHPKLHEYLLRDFESGGLGMKEPLDFIGVPYYDNQLNMFEYMNDQDKETDYIEQLPTPQENEKQTDFVRRCIFSNEAKSMNKSSAEIYDICLKKYQERSQ